MDVKRDLVKGGMKSIIEKKENGNRKEICQRTDFSLRGKKRGNKVGSKLQAVIFSKETWMPNLIFELF